MRAGRNFLFYLHFHRNCSERLLVRAGQVEPADLETSIEREHIRMRKMADEVMGEVHRMKAFVRLNPLGPFILYGFLKPRHRIGEYVCEHFARRNAGIIVVLGNGRESWICLCRGGGIWRERGNGLAESLVGLKSALQRDNGPQNEIGWNDLDVDRLWQTYYDSQNCPERENLTAFQRHMPRRDQEAAGLRLVNKKKEASLEDFFGGNEVSPEGSGEKSQGMAGRRSGCSAVVPEGFFDHPEHQCGGDNQEERPAAKRQMLDCASFNFKSD